MRRVPVDPLHPVAVAEGAGPGAVAAREQPAGRVPCSQVRTTLNAVPAFVVTPVDVGEVRCWRSSAGPMSTSRRGRRRSWMFSTYVRVSRAASRRLLMSLAVPPPPTWMP